MAKDNHIGIVYVLSNRAMPGSTNFDFRSMEYNFECNAFIYSKTINEKMKTAFFADLAQSTRITSSTWRRRPFVQKFKESVVRLMSPVL